jgi:hypothetical protein
VAIFVAKINKDTVMRKYLNNLSVPLSMAVFLATDTYDHDEDTISVTTLIKPVRQVILAGRVPASQGLVDISGLVKSRMGTSIHDGIERAWVNNKDAAMKALGYPQRVIDRVVVNPDPEKVTKDQIPVYLEIRTKKKIMGRIVSGKFDFVAEGSLEDFKSTSVMAWTKKDRELNYKLQGSLYRWLNPEIITDDTMGITFLFTDYQAYRSKTDPDYPPHATPQKRIPLMSVEATEEYVKSKIRLLDQHQDTPEENLPLCPDESLWRKETVYKYYSNPEKTQRATKDFKTDKQAALLHAAKAGKGFVKEIPGTVLACKYCDAFPLCSQKDALIADGSLTL